MRPRLKSWHSLGHFCLVPLTLSTVLGCGTTAPRSLSEPAGEYQLQRVNNNGVPALIFLNETPYFKQLWRGGSMTITADGRWEDSLLVETVTAQSDSLTTVKLEGSYVAFPDHLEFTLDPGISGSWASAEVGVPKYGMLEVRVTPTTAFYFGFPR